jgi:hypothetical protein
MAGLDLNTYEEGQLPLRLTPRMLNVLKDTLQGHDSLNEQGLRVAHVHVQEAHKGDTLRPATRQFWIS